jgi:hypothetical protein
VKKWLRKLFPHISEHAPAASSAGSIALSLADIEAFIILALICRHCQSKRDYGTTTFAETLFYSHSIFWTPPAEYTQFWISALYRHGSDGNLKRDRYRFTGLLSRLFASCIREIRGCSEVSTINQSAYMVIGVVYADMMKASGRDLTASISQFLSITQDGKSSTSMLLKYVYMEECRESVDGVDVDAVMQTLPPTGSPRKNAKGTVSYYKSGSRLQRQLKLLSSLRGSSKPISVSTPQPVVTDKKLPVAPAVVHQSRTERQLAVLSKLRSNK